MDEIEIDTKEEEPTPLNVRVIPEPIKEAEEKDDPWYDKSTVSKEEIEEIEVEY